MSDKSYAVGIDLGGTSIKYGICSSDGEIIKEFSRPTQAEKPVAIILDNLALSAQEALKLAQSENLSIEKVGIGTPGSVDVERGFLHGNTPNFMYWRQVDIKKQLEAVLPLPVYVDNDANMMALGESEFGAGNEKSYIICITVGTGIGGGIIIDGELYRGHNYAGSELGHMSISYNGNKCRCGGMGCWETYASATAMINRYNELQSEQAIKNSFEIFQKYDIGDEIAHQIVNEEIQFLAVGLASLVNIFNPQTVIIGGGVSEAGKWFTERVAQKTASLAMENAMNGAEITLAKLGNKAGWMGAAAFAMKQSTKC